MEALEICRFLSLGENVCIEFKRGGNGFEDDALQTVCSFSNRFGGDIFLGITDDGSICGVPEKAAPDMVKNFISRISNQNLFSPTLYLVPEILQYESKTIIHVHIPPSAEVHTFKKDIYDRVGDADVKVTATGSIAQMYIRKQNIFTERKIYPYVKMENLRLDMLPRLRTMALNNSNTPRHLWSEMDDETLLKSMNLFSTDMTTGESGFNLAAILLLGKDEVIQSVLPAYSTDALLRRVNVDRYDDREIIQTNLIESYEQLVDFGHKHLLDKFYLEDTQRKNLRNIIVREMISNILMHREYTSPYQAKFIIEKDRMYTENANRAVKETTITPSNLEPISKNPIIAKFFREIGYADTLGSGVRKLFKYTKPYSGKDPVFQEGDIFRIIVPLDDSYSFDADINPQGTSLEDNVPQYVPQCPSKESLESQIVELIKSNPKITRQEIAAALGVTTRTIGRKLQAMSAIKHVGSGRNGHWEIIDSEK